MSNLYRVDYPVTDGKRIKRKTESLFCWAPVAADGEVEMERITQFDDDLDDLATGWRWVKFELKALPEDQ